MAITIHDAWCYRDTSTTFVRDSVGFDVVIGRTFATLADAKRAVLACAQGRPGAALRYHVDGYFYDVGAGPAGEPQLDTRCLPRGRISGGPRDYSAP